MKRLPIDDALTDIAEKLRRHRAIVVTAPPGSGKTTRVPPALVADGPLILLQPRRIAARSLAQRIADERGWTMGREVGWHVRGERRFNEDTSLIVATEGILTARLLADPLLESFRTVVLDEFHERTVHADMALALARQAWLVRDDLRLVVMSATLDAEPLAAFLDDCPIVDVPGRPYPVDIEYRPQLSVIDAAREACTVSSGHVLVFMPGAMEIERAATTLRSQLGTDRSVQRLYGALSSREQDAALTESGSPRLILATNIAETSLTIDGVTHVVDSGLHRLLRQDSGSGLDRLDTERIPQDAADQRAGRAGRTAPGQAWRLWDERDPLRDHREPELFRVDLAAALLDICIWGEDPGRFDWFEVPPQDSIADALELLQRLGAVDGIRVTKLGRQMRRLALHPRLARMVLAAPRSREIRRAAIALAEGWRPRTPAAHGESDLHALADRFDDAPPHVKRNEIQLEKRVKGLASPDEAVDFLRAVFAGYADRVAQRRRPREIRFQMMSGGGAMLARESQVLDAEWIVAVDSRMVRQSGHGSGDTIRIHHASAIDPAWLEADRSEVDAIYDAQRQQVVGRKRDYYGALVIEERSAEVSDEQAAKLLLQAWREQPLDELDRQLNLRLRFAGQSFDFDEAFQHHVWSQRRLPTTTREELLSFEVRKELDRQAPTRWKLPTGNHASISYREDGAIVSGAKLQELFGLFETPRFGPNKVSLTLELRAPNGRTVQTTRDLAGFWQRGYAEVRKELRGRYPKHPWPEDPMTALPSARTKRFRRRPS